MSRSLRSGQAPDSCGQCFVWNLRITRIYQIAQKHSSPILTFSSSHKSRWKMCRQQMPEIHVYRQCTVSVPVWHEDSKEVSQSTLWKGKYLVSYWHQMSVNVYWAASNIQKTTQMKPKRQLSYTRVSQIQQSVTMSCIISRKPLRKLCSRGKCNFGHFLTPWSNSFGLNQSQARTRSENIQLQT